MRILFIAIIAASFLTGCLKTRNEVRDSDQRHVMQQQVATMQRSSADNTGRFSDMEEQMRNLNGRVEVIENRTERMSMGAEGMLKNSQQQTQDINQRMAIYQEAISKIERDVQVLNAEIQSLKAQQAAYDAVKGSASSGGGSRSSLDVAEDHFDKKEWKQAILNYQKYRDANPKGAKFADATYKIGVSFQELGMKDEARTFYDEVVAKSPKSESARRAKIRLKSIK